MTKENLQNLIAVIADMVASLSDNGEETLTSSEKAVLA